MDYRIMAAKEPQLEHIMKIYGFARQFMTDHGNPTQWGSSYPSEEMLRMDIQQGKLYTVSDCSGIHGVFFFDIGEDPTYDFIEHGCWRSELPYGVIHRIASDGSGGILAAAVNFAQK